MKLAMDWTINGKFYPKGSEVPWYAIYPFFIAHMLVFGGVSFTAAYGPVKASPDFLLLWGGVSLTIYAVFYVGIFGVDEVKWMLVNGALGVLGIYTQVDWLLSLFGKRIGDYRLDVHFIPFLYYVFYSFLLRQALLDLAGAREDEAKKEGIGYAYVALSIALSLASYFSS